MTITITTNGQEFTAEFVKSEAAGYSAGRLLLNLPNGELVSVYKVGRKWVEAYIRDGICRRSHEHATRQAALNAAAERFAALSIEAEAFTA